MKPFKRFNQAIFSLAVLFLSCSPAAATVLFEGIPTVSLLQLEKMRGGFVTKGGWKVSLGIEKVVRIDGVLKAHTTLHIPDLAKLHKLGNGIKTRTLMAMSTAAGKGQPFELNKVVPDTAPGFSEFETTTPVSNSGPTELANGGLQSGGTTLPAQQTVPVQLPTSELQPAVVTQVLNNGFATLIQNSMDQKHIQEMTVIHADIFNNNLFRQVELMSRINDQLINALH